MTGILHAGMSAEDGGQIAQAARHVREYRYNKDKEALYRRMRRVEGQARGVRRMIEEDRYCPDIIQQLTALSRAADEVALILLQNHIEGCVTDYVCEERGTEMIAELMSIIRRTLRA